MRQVGCEKKAYLPVYHAVGGAEGIRTPDPLLAKQVLSQLSYGPTRAGSIARACLRPGQSSPASVSPTTS